MSDRTGKHDSSKTSDSSKSGYGGKHSTDRPSTPRTNVAPFFRGTSARPTTGGGR